MADAGDFVIEANGLAKRFEEVQAVNDVSFEVRRSEVYGFLGPNGAGKTTTINMLTGLARPDAGTIRIDGIDCTPNPKAAQHRIGVIPDDSNLYPELTGFENLAFCGALYGMARARRETRARELLQTFGLTEAGDRLFKGYSRGMKRKLTIAAGIMHEPPILFLDEPTTGIDVAAARQIRQLLADLHSAGTTVFLTTHYIEEAERLCDRIAFIVKGKIVRVDTVESLMQPVRERHVVEFVLDGSAENLAGELTTAFPDMEAERISPDRLRLASKQPAPVGPQIRFFEEHGRDVLEARRVRPSLEEVFVKVTGIEANAMKQDAQKKGGGA
jgi:ABC-2 type transport system ATP-binding protein